MDVSVVSMKAHVKDGESHEDISTVHLHSMYVSHVLYKHEHNLVRPQHKRVDLALSNKEDLESFVYCASNQLLCRREINT
jgi:hypothetical protein